MQNRKKRWKFGLKQIHKITNLWIINNVLLPLRLGFLFSTAQLLNWTFLSSQFFRWPFFVKNGVATIRLIFFWIYTQNNSLGVILLYPKLLMRSPSFNRLFIISWHNFKVVESERVSSISASTVSTVAWSHKSFLIQILDLKKILFVTVF